LFKLHELDASFDFEGCPSLEALCHNGCEDDWPGGDGEFDQVFHLAPAGRDWFTIHCTNETCEHWNYLS
jgi:hypothetical protein